MANEAVLRDRLADPIDFTVADGNGIEKGTILILSDPRTASGAASNSAAIEAPVAGIAAREKVASDGRTRLAVFQQGIFDVIASGAVTVGSPVVLGGSNNYVKAPTLSQVAEVSGSFLASGASIMGYALETAADEETFQIKLNIGG